MSIINNSDKIYVFMGNMNSMPLLYARELRLKGERVLFLVDAKKDNHLSRPESFYKDINYPYPDWILEMILPSQLLVALFPAAFSYYYKFIIKRKVGSQKNFQYVLNGFFVSMAPSLSKFRDVVCLSHGSDLDTWANIDIIPVLQKSFKHRSFLKFLPKFISDKLISRAVSNQFLGFLCAKSVLYFPRGFNFYGDKVINKISENGVKHIPVRGFSSSGLVGKSRDFKKSSKKLVILCSVRFIFKSFPDGNKEYNKGNDIIIRGLSKFVKYYNNIEIHFFEKGEDLSFAKKMCKEEELDSYVIWHKELPFTELLDLYEYSDICFDQVGSHWVGAVGAYALWFGKPLIANIEREIAAGTWPKKNPVLQAKTEDEIFDHLVNLLSEVNRKRISEESKIFFDDHLDFRKYVDEIFN